MTISVTVVDWLKVSLNTVRGYSVNSKLELVLWHRPQRRSGLWKQIANNISYCRLYLNEKMRNGHLLKQILF
jgi:hypothetical protein